MPRFLVALLLLLPALHSQANCDGLVKQANAALQYPDNAISGVRFFAACKAMPDAPGKTIIALAHFQMGSSFTSPASEMGLYDLDTMLVDTKSGNIISHLFQKGALSSDAIVLDKITIDTGRYNLAPHVRAFGIRIHHHHPKRYNPHENEDLNLYMASGKKIRLVLDALETIDSGGERGECDGTYSDVRRTVAMAKTSSRGYADLVVTTTATASETRLVDEQCAEIKAPPAVTQDTLHYDGNIYPH